MNCENCNALYRLQTDGNVYVRNICTCESTKPCTHKKCKETLVQAELAPGSEDVTAYWCRDHAHSEFLDIEPEEKVDTRIQDDEALVGMEIEAREIIGKLTKKDVEDYLRSEKFKVQCLTCQKIQPYSKRRAVKNDNGWAILCSDVKCDGPGYRIVD